MQANAQIGLTMRDTMSRQEIDTSWLEHLDTVIAQNPTEAAFDEDVDQLIIEIIWSCPVRNLGHSTITQLAYHHDNKPQRKR